MCPKPVRPIMSKPADMLRLKTQLQPFTSFLRREAVKYCTSTSSPVSREDDDVVIVGAGVAGLATAVALKRLGIKSTVLEQAETMRTEGVSITLSRNGWTALDAIGVGDELRNQFLEMKGIELKTNDGRVLQSIRFQKEDPSQEVRGVERRSLLAVLANQLPSNAISFSSRVETIENQGSKTILKLQNGTQLFPKIVIASDGVHSPVARWMGLREPKYAGHCVIRGLGVYPEGQPFEQVIQYTYGRGVRAGLVPISSTKVFWFICSNSPSPGPRISEASLLREKAFELLKTFPSEIQSVVDRAPDDCVVKSPLVDRWLWPGITPPPAKGNVVLIGDAWHPMTPNLGQGACCALEDSVVLAKKLAEALNGNSSVEDAFRSYTKERWSRVFPITVTANLIGKFFQSESPILCSLRNNIVIPKLFSFKKLSQKLESEHERLK